MLLLFLPYGAELRQRTKKLFEPFFSTKARGIGLAWLRLLIIDAHHGSIAVESDYGRELVIIKLPLNNERLVMKTIKSIS